MSPSSSFIDLCLQAGALRFGSFTLKSGRISPYFFNAGLFSTGAAMAELGRSYAAALRASGLPFDMVFGPAYKGIPLVTSTAIALADHHSLDYPWAFNRKESKDHGERGSIVGAPLRGRVIIVDDVITAGTAIRESVDIIRAAGAEPAGVLIALDRQERGLDRRSAVQEVRQNYGLPVVSILKFGDIVAHIERSITQRHSSETPGILAALHAYREEYGVDQEQND